LNALLAEGRRGDAVAHFMTVGIGIPAEFVAGMRQQPHWGMMEAIAPTLAYDTAIMIENQGGRPLTDARWASLTMPVLVMGGDAGTVTMQNAVKATAAAIPSAELRMLEGQPHDVAAEVMAPLLVEFFGR
jgi:pimeloyl-ACP methyl ester carboxylesterase